MCSYFKVKIAVLILPTASLRASSDAAVEIRYDLEHQIRSRQQWRQMTSRATASIDRRSY